MAEIGPYVRALASGLHALAPNEDYVPLRPALAHVFALDPRMSDTILNPAEIDFRSGMPGFTWMERVLAEQVVARERTDADDPNDEAIGVAERLDPTLARRLIARIKLHKHLRREDLLPKTEASAELRRLRGSARIILTYDRMAPQGYWVRIRADLQAPPGRKELGGLAVLDHSVRVEPGLAHLLTRHSFTPLMLLREQLQGAVDATAMRLSRSVVGPFWFPEVMLPDHVPPVLGTGLLLHIANEVVAHDIVHSVHRDPLKSPPVGEFVPVGFGVFRERRIAASLPIIDAAQQWYSDAGINARVVPIRPRAAGVVR